MRAFGRHAITSADQCTFVNLPPDRFAFLMEQDDPSIFTRSWFAWANTLFGELMLAVAKQRPHLIFGQK